MGMFDSLRCEVPLPDGREFKGLAQTKSLDCLMDTYRITADGRLEREIVEFEDVPEHERPPEPPEDAHWLDKISWNQSLTRESCRYWKELDDVHLDILFYYTEKIDKGDDKAHYRFYQYTARFADGKLTRLTASSVEEW